MSFADHWSVLPSLYCGEVLKLMSDPLLAIRNNHAAFFSDLPIVSAGDLSMYVHTSDISKIALANSGYSPSTGRRTLSFFVGVTSVGTLPLRSWTELPGI
ncbi:hypothetical protein Fuma_02887 [Fuerstiella marisgermanici]|uniref:Uncharacterized protein n=1 Tax=Fuerstiella marisgermanici TaxID=1891926 RepID=A0A1P8WGV6_9PLAN|nr:hypothetical protein Fuma_02887 [Fuerstiella marisgermanici]